MAKLPDPYAPRSTPSPSRQIVTISDPGRLPRARAQAAAEEGAVGTAAIRAEGDARQGVIRSNLALSDSLQRTGDYLFQVGKQMQERKYRQELVRAKHEFMKQKVIADSELNDADYGTYSNRYAEKINKVRDELAATIGHSVMREEFIGETEIDITQGIVHQNERALSAERAAESAALSKRQNERDELLTRATDNATRESILNDSNDDLHNATEKRYISPEQAENERQRFTEVYATNRLAALPQEQVIAVLEEAKQKQTWASYIPFTERERTLRQAQAVVAERVMDQQSFNAAKAIIAGNETYSGQVQAAGQIKDAEMHKRVMTLLDTNAARVSRMEQEQQEALAKTALDFLDQNPDATLMDIPAEVRLAMSAGDRGYLAEVVKERSEGKPISEERATKMFTDMRDQYVADPKSILKWSRLEVEVLPGEYRDRVMDWRNKVANGDTKVPALESHVTTLGNKALDDMKIGDNKAGKKRRAQFLGKLDQQIAHFTEDHGRKPMYSEIESISDRLTLQVAEDGWTYGDSSRFAFEATDEDLASLVVPTASRDEILAELQKTYPGQSFNDEQIREIYLRLKGLK